MSLSLFAPPPDNFSLPKSSIDTLPPISLIDIRATTSEIDDPTQATIQLEAFKGLAKPGPDKELPGLLLYDQAGLLLFEQITYQTEYYLTGVEIGLLAKHASNIANQIQAKSWIIELGGGALRKTAIILDELEAQKKRVDYFSLDVNRPELLRTLRELQGRYKYVKLHGLWGTYEDSCQWLSNQTTCPPYSLLWLGSSIGNMTRADAANLLRGFGLSMRKIDKMIVAIDGRNRDPELIRRAYNDQNGVTRRFALNILHNLNDMFGYDVLDVNSFDYEPYYSEAKGRNEAYLVCKEDMKLSFPGHQEPVMLNIGDRIRFAYSHKYSRCDRKQLYTAAEARVLQEWTWGSDEYTLAMLSW